MGEPSISVLMGVYYKKETLDFLCRSIESIQRQTVSDFELLICDDGSSIQAQTFLQNAAVNDPRIRLVKDATSFALPNKLNACLRQARGQYIARMDDDDWSHPERFARQLSFLDSHPEFAFVGSNVNLWKDSIIGQRNLAEFPTVQDFFFVQPYIHPALMFRKAALLAVGGYSQEKHAILCEDYDLLLRLYAQGYRGANLQEYLLDYTVPATAKGSRKMRHRLNESETRYRRFKELGQLPKALPYVIKPVMVGLLPEYILRKVKKMP